MDDVDPPKSSWNDSTKTTVGVLVALVVVLVVAAIGVATVRDASDTIRKAVATTTSVAPVPAAPTAGSDLPPEHAQTVDDVKAQVSAIRGLAWKGPLPIKVLTKAQLAQKVRELTAKEVADNREEITADETVLKLLQLIPKDLDFAKTLDEILAGGVLGYYDDETKELFVGFAGSGALDPATRSVLAHELTHALTDQWFDFGGRMKELDDADRQEQVDAFVALLEGDAKLLESRFFDEYLTEDEQALYTLAQVFGTDRKSVV